MSCEASEAIFRASEAIFRESRSFAGPDLPCASVAERSNLQDLIEVLLPHPGGLRRWSIMRAIRALRENRSVEVTPKVEIEIERVFRKFCAGEPLPKGSKGRRTSEEALFHRPKEKAGEVWAVNLDRARLWLETRAATDIDTP